MAPSAKLTIAGPGSVGADLSHGHGAIFVDDCNQYFDYSCGMIFRGSGTEWVTRFTSADTIRMLR